MDLAPPDHGQNCAKMPKTCFLKLVQGARIWFYTPFWHCSSLLVQFWWPLGHPQNHHFDRETVAERARSALTDLSTYKACFQYLSSSKRATSRHFSQHGAGSGARALLHCVALNRWVSAWSGRVTGELHAWLVLRGTGRMSRVAVSGKFVGGPFHA